MATAYLLLVISLYCVCTLTTAIAGVLYFLHNILRMLLALHTIISHCRSSAPAGAVDYCCLHGCAVIRRLI